MMLAMFAGEHRYDWDDLLPAVHHLRFLEWVGAPESARLLDCGPGAWIRSLSR